jgi:uncharacterized membrane protein
MRFNLKKISENTLFTLNVFIVFLLVAGSRLQVPEWLHPAGRLHPLLLHFPIVILILTMIAALFRSSSANNAGLPQNLIDNLLLAGTLLAALTAISGLFLSKEQGYEGATLQWHKWTGVTVVFAASLIYAYRNYFWNRLPFARVFSLLTVLLIVIAGHYGATLTHGDDFLLPVKTVAAKSVPLDQGIVFDHVIKPFIDKKCAGCHNADKSKGGLILTDSASFIKGGKTGKLFTAGNPQISLLLKRIHLPEGDEKRMPPEGKPSLSSDEITMLELWIASGADFAKKVIALPVNDSLRQMATVLLDAPEVFEFAAADEQAVQQLNNDYRLVTNIAKNSPALAVKLYNRAVYSTKVLEELSPVKTQIISLDLNKLPVTDQDLKIIAGFQNLRTLNLNFTDITGAGLKELVVLKHIKSLSLSGTKINYNDLQVVKTMKSLTQVAVWNTAMSTKELEQLQQNNLAVTFISGFSDNGTPVKLSPPQLSDNAVVFKSKLPLTLRHPIYGVDIRYTTDGTEPDSINAPLLKEGVFISDNATVKAKAYKQGWGSSDVAVFTFYKNGFKPDSVYFLKAPFENYRGNNVYTFFDGELGGRDMYRYNKNKWVGFKGGNMEMMMLYDQPQPVSSVTLHALVAVGSHVFPPASIQIWGGTDKDNLTLLSTVKPALPTPNTDTTNNITSSFSPRAVSYLKIVATPVIKLPVWADKDRGLSMMLVDEMLIN